MTATKTPSSTTGPSLNVYRKISVIRKPSDSLSYEDASGNVKTVSAEQLGDAIASTPLETTNKSKPKQDIPVPLIGKVGSYERDVSEAYAAPLSYVRSHRPTPEELKHTIEYVVDVEDEAWLKNNPKFGGAAAAKKSDKTTASPPCLSLDLFERMIDILEKETAFDSIISTNQADDFFRQQIPELYSLFPSKPRHGSVATKHVINDVYSYWMQKRSRLKRPLFRRFWPPTSLDDTNPHLVFRPREKEKYKLRKKRQNDMDAFRKMKQLRQDFDTIRAVLRLIRRREELSHQHVKIQIELHRQKLYDLVDTSGTSRQSIMIRKSSIDARNAIPTVFDIQTGARNRTKKGGRKGGDGSGDFAAALGASFAGKSGGDTHGSSDQIAAGQNNGKPAPNFMHLLSTRETFATSWEGAVPHVSSFRNSYPDPTHTFRYRPRVGRGGRVCIDRLPRPVHPTIAQSTVFTASRGMPLSTRAAVSATATKTKMSVDGAVLPNMSMTGAKEEDDEEEEDTTRLLDLLPRPLDTERTSRRIEELCVASIFEDHHSAMVAAANPSAEDPENDGEEVVVRADSWLDTDDQLWGEERHCIGPL